MNVHEIDIRKTGLLFFDMLNVYYHGAPKEKKERMVPVVDNAVRLRDAARRASIPIMFAKANHRRDGRIRNRCVTDTDMQLRPWPGGECDPRVHGATEGSWEGDVIDEIKPAPEDMIVPKYRWSAFYETYLDLALRASGLDTLFLSGGSVEVGIAATAYAARDLDLNLIIVRDACSSSQDDVFAIFMDKVFPKMARVRTTKQALEMIEQNAAGKASLKA